MLGGLGRALERHFGRLVAARVTEHLPPELERIGMRLEGECAIEREQRPVLIAQFVGDVAELVPDERQVRVDFDRPLQLGQRVLVATQLGKRGTAKGEGEAGLAEGRSGAIGKLQRFLFASTGAQQLEVFGPACFEFGL